MDLNGYGDMTGCYAADLIRFCGIPGRYFETTYHKKGERNMSKKEKFLLKAAIAFALMFSVTPAVNAMHLSLIHI